MTKNRKMMTTTSKGMGGEKGLELAPATAADDQQQQPQHESMGNNPTNVNSNEKKTTTSRRNVKKDAKGGTKGLENVAVAEQQSHGSIENNPHENSIKKMTTTTKGEESTSANVVEDHQSHGGMEESSHVISDKTTTKRRSKNRKVASKETKGLQLAPANVITENYSSQGSKKVGNEDEGEQFDDEDDRPGAIAMPGFFSDDENVQEGDPGPSSMTTATTTTTTRSSPTVANDGGDGTVLVSAEVVVEDDEMEFQRRVRERYGEAVAVDVAPVGGTLTIPSGENGDDKNKKTTQFSSRRRWFYILGAVLVISVIIAVVLVVVTTASPKETTDSDLPFTADDGDLQVRSEVAKVVGDIFGAPTAMNLNVTGSPQRRAALWIGEDDWMLDFDTLASDANANNTTAEVNRFRQRFALATLFFATGGPSWRNNFNFLSLATHECMWNNQTDDSTDTSLPIHGVLCNDDSVATHINLPDNGLVGTIPWYELSHLNISSLHLSGNDLAGSLLGDEFSRMENLEVLILSNVGLGGSVPSSLVQLKELKLLSLSGNGLVGSIEYDLDTMENLRILDLQDNSLTGKLPQKLPASLIDVALARNQFTGFLPMEWSTSLPHLEALDISENSIEGGILNYLTTSFVNLTLLSLHGNQFSGTIPYGWNRLTRLEYLDISSNTLGGRLPQFDGGIQPSAAQVLVFEGNSLTGTLPSAYGTLPSLMFLTVARNQLTGTIPTFFENQPYLGK